VIAINLRITNEYLISGIFFIIFSEHEVLIEIFDMLPLFAQRSDCCLLGEITLLLIYTAVGLVNFVRKGIRFFRLLDFS